MYYVQEWCGCFIPPSQAMFTALGTAPKDLSDISSATLCDPLCIADQAVKRYSSLTVIECLFQVNSILSHSSHTSL